MYYKDFKMAKVTDSIAREVGLLSAKYLLALPTPNVRPSLLRPFFEVFLSGLSKKGLLYTVILVC